MLQFRHLLRSAALLLLAEVSAFAQKPEGAAPTAAAPEAISIAEQMTGTRAILQQWAAQQQAIANERREWEQGKSILQQRVELVEREIQNVQNKIAENKQKLADSETKKQQMLKDKATAEEASKVLAAKISELEAAVRKLLPSTPKPTQDKLKAAFDALPPAGISDEDLAKKFGLGGRYAILGAILSEFSTANTLVLQGLEMIDVGGGRNAEVNVVYLGLGQAYYLTKDGEDAGVGIPFESGWKWQPDKSIAKEVLQMLDMLKKSGHPRVVPLPVTIK